MYTDPDFKTGKALREAVAAGVKVSVFSPGPFPCPSDGQVSVEGPHYPKAHTWYLRVVVAGGIIVKVLR